MRIRDCRNCLFRVTEEDGTTTEYEYDAENTRTAEIKNGVKTIYVTDKEAEYSQVLQETAYTYSRLTGTGRKLSVKTYTYGAGLISEHRSGQNAAQDDTRNNLATLYYHYNHLGSTTAVTDRNGSIVYKFAYGTYGELAAVTDGTGATLIQAQTGKTVQECLNEAVTKTGIRFLYNGKYGITADENGLYYMRARYYNTDIKRFINRDVVDGSMENSQSLNKYSYVQGNPVNLTGPFGLSPVGGNGDDGGNNDDDDDGGWLKGQWDKLDPGIKHLIKSMIPGYGAYLQFADAEEYRERGDYFNAVRSATGGLANVALTAGIIALLGVAAPAMMAVAMVTSAVVLCLDVATSCYQYGYTLSSALGELMETGRISLETATRVKSAGEEAYISLGLGFLGATSIDNYLAQATTATGVAESAVESGSKTNQTLLSGEEWYRYFQDTYGVDNVNWNVSSFDDMLNHPTSLRGYSADEIGQILGNSWTRSTYGSNGGGWKFIEDAHPDNMVFYHGGVHEGAYWGVKSGQTGTIKIVNTSTYVPLPKDKATIIYGEDW